MSTAWNVYHSIPCCSAHACLHVITTHSRPNAALLASASSCECCPVCTPAEHLVEFCYAPRYRTRLTPVSLLQPLCTTLLGKRYICTALECFCAFLLSFSGAVRDVEVVWVLKHGHIGDAFFDVDAAEFLLAELQHQQLTQQTDNKELQQQQQQQDHGQHTGQMLPPPQQPQQPQQKQQQLIGVGHHYSKGGRHASWTFRQHRHRG